MKTIYLVVPCYNEHDALPLTAPVMLKKLRELTDAGKISPESGVLFIDERATSVSRACAFPATAGIKMRSWRGS